MVMSEKTRQPRPDDAVLGGQSQAPIYGAVLGGIEGVKQRLERDNLEEKKVALQDALKYGDKGIEFLFGILEQKESWELEWLAYGVLEKQPSAIIKSRLENYFPWYEFESVTVNRRGEIIKRTPGRAKYYREDLGNGIYLDMVYISGGKFMMGSPSSEKKDSFDGERPQHEVTVPSYWMGKYAVTQEQWEAVMGNNPSRFKGAKRPVEQVSWNKCQKFCGKLSKKTRKNYHLPSEAEWEYGCRAGTKTAFHSGETITTDLANYNGNFIYAEEGKGIYREKTVEVGTYPPNAFGLYEMHGNLWEWCEDGWHDNYKEAPKNGKVWTAQIDTKVLRGASWYFSTPSCCRSANRNCTNRAYDSDQNGFRLVCPVGRT